MSDAVRGRRFAQQPGEATPIERSVDAGLNRRMCREQSLVVDDGVKLRRCLDDRSAKLCEVRSERSRLVQIRDPLGR
jgi:hypothetical protein